MRVQLFHLRSSSSYDHVFVNSWKDYRNVFSLKLVTWLYQIMEDINLDCRYGLQDSDIRDGSFFVVFHGRAMWSVSCMITIDHIFADQQYEKDDASDHYRSWVENDFSRPCLDDTKKFSDWIVVSSRCLSHYVSNHWISSPSLSIDQ